MNLLIVEDDADVAAYVVQGLQQSGHTAQWLEDGNTALIEAQHGGFDVMVIDRMLPGLDGISLIKALRAIGIDTPVLILSALGEVNHRVEGLRAGSDDYLTKPFAFSELLARIEALARRNKPGSQESSLQVADLSLDLLARRAQRRGQDIELLPREFALLEFLMRHAGQVVTRTMLLESVWGLNFDPQTNIVDVHISRLRKKIDKDFDHPLLHTMRGAGYVIRD